MMNNTVLKDLKAWLSTTAGITVLLCTVALIWATIDRGPYIFVNTVVAGGMLALMAISLAIVFGVMNIVHFALGDFFMIGGLAAYFVFTPLNAYNLEHPSAMMTFLAPVLAITAGVVAGALTGIITEVTIFRELRKRTRENWVMNTFLLTVGLNTVLVNGHQLIFGADFKGIVGYWEGAPLQIFGAFISLDRAIAFLIAIVAIVGLYLFMKFTRIGQAIRAVSQDETGALMVGIGLTGIMIFTQAIAGALAGLAGSSLLFLFPSYPTVGLYPLYMAWFVVILVGLGNMMGALIGGFMVALFKELTSAYLGEGWEFVLPSIIIMLVLLFKPSGIFGSEVRGVMDK